MESEESIINRQTALYSLKLLSRLLAKDHPSPFKEVCHFSALFATAVMLQNNYVVLLKWISDSNVVVFCMFRWCPHPLKCFRPKMLMCRSVVPGLPVGNPWGIGRSGEVTSGEENSSLPSLNRSNWELCSDLWKHRHSSNQQPWQSTCCILFQLPEFRISYADWKVRTTISGYFTVPQI